MFVEIESYLGDIKLEIPFVTRENFEIHVKTVERLYNPAKDNFVDLLCEKYGYKLIAYSKSIQPEFVYDRDVQEIYAPYHG